MQPESLPRMQPPAGMKTSRQAIKNDRSDRKTCHGDRKNDRSDGHDRTGIRSRKPGGTTEKEEQEKRKSGN